MSAMEAMTNRPVILMIVLLALLAGCASTGEMVSLDKRRLDVPEIDASVPAIPLRLAIYIDRSVLGSRIYSKNPMTNQVHEWGVIGPEVLNTFVRYAPRLFAHAALTPRFPANGVADDQVDAILTVDFAIAEWAWSGVFDSELFNDTEIAVSIYAPDGTLIKRYSAYGSGVAHRDGWNQARTMQEMIDKKAAGVSPAVRAALLDFPAPEVLGHLARFSRGDITTSRRRWELAAQDYRAHLGVQQARVPQGAENGFEHSRRMERFGALAAGIGTAALSQMSAQGLGNPALSQATNLYVQQLMGNSKDFQLGLAAGQLGAGLISLGGRRDGASAGSKAGESYCQELLNMANQCRASQGRMASMPGAPRPGGKSGGSGQAGSFNACYDNYMNAYKAACQ